MPDLRVLEGDHRRPADRRPRARTADRLEIACDRLRRLEQLLRHSGMPAEAMAVGDIGDLVASIAGDVPRGNVGISQ